MNEVDIREIIARLDERQKASDKALSLAERLDAAHDVATSARYYAIASLILALLGIALTLITLFKH